MLEYFHGDALRIPAPPSSDGNSYSEHPGWHLFKTAISVLSKGCGPDEVFEALVKIADDELHSGLGLSMKTEITQRSFCRDDAAHRFVKTEAKPLLKAIRRLDGGGPRDLVRMTIG